MARAHALSAGAVLVLSSWAAALEPPPQRAVLQLDPVNVMTAGPSTAFDFTAGVTLELWLFLQEPVAGHVLATWANPDGPPISVNFLEDGVTPSYQQPGRGGGGAGGVQVDTTTALTLRQWHHLAVAGGPGAARIYLDGAVIGTVEDPSIDPPIDVARAPLYLGGQLGGAIRQVRVWARPLAPAEVTHWAANAVTGGEAGLVAAWPCDDGYGRAARDLGPHGLPLAVIPDRNGGHPQWVRAEILARPYLAQRVQAIDRPLHRGALLDLDFDGDLDLLSWTGGSATHSALPLSAWRRDASGRFDEATTELLSSPVPAFENFIEPAEADFDGDGRTDVLAVDYGPDLPPYPGGVQRLLMRRADGGLADETAARLPAVRLGAFAALVGDLDGDGDDDACPVLFRAVVPPLLVNDGTGRFSLAPDRFPESSASVAYLAGALLDAEGDGDLDVFLGYSGSIGNQAPDIVRDRLFLNDGAGRFAEAPPTVLPPRYRGLHWRTSSAAAADFDGDGRTDLALVVFTGFYEKPRFLLFLANGDGTFRDGSAGIPQTTDLLDGNLAGLHAVHLNADGHPDLLITRDDGAMSLQRLYLNTGNARFVDATEALPLSHALLLPGDLENDGDLDIVAFPTWANAVVTLENVRPLDVATWGDFSLGMEPGEIDVGTGTSRHAQVVVVRGGFPAPITLEATTSAPGLTVSLTDAEIAGDEPVELVVIAAGSAAPGRRTVRVTARSGDAIHVTELLVSVHRTLGSRVRRGGGS